MVPKIEKNKKVIKVGEIGEIDQILTVEEKRMARIGSKKKMSLEMTQGKMELKAKRLKSSKMRIKKRIKK